MHSRYKSSYFHLKKNNYLHSLSKKEKEALRIYKMIKFLICKPDKKQGVAILDKKSYLTKMKKIAEKSILKPVTIGNNLINLSKF